jgi:hypothetical protein
MGQFSKWPIFYRIVAIPLHGSNQLSANLALIILAEPEASLGQDGIRPQTGLLTNLHFS